MIGIRREDKNRWERRAPLTPDHVAELIRAHDVAVCFEPSPRRAFPDVDYQTAGAALSEELAACGTILGIKEIPPHRLLAGKTYAFFAHVTKGQPYNMPMLRRILELGCALIDYERITDERGRRLVFFGRQAGHAGMIDTLWALGQSLEREGIFTGLEEVRPAHEYSDLDEASRHIVRVGERLRRTGIPAELHPAVFVFTGSGNVTKGALEIFDRLPVQDVSVDELPGLARDTERPRNVLFRLHLGRAERYERIGGGAFDAAEWNSHPARYRSAPHRWLPHATALVNGAFWTPGMPPVVGRDALAQLFAAAAPPRLRVIADIACDVNGGVEATVKITSPDDPIYVYDPVSGEARPPGGARGPIVLAVDNLPCELPVESSEHFGDALLRYVPAIDRCDWSLPTAELALPPEIRRALVAHRGTLTPEYGALAGALGAGRP